MKISTTHELFIGLFLILTGSILTQCKQKEEAIISDEEWALLPSDGPYLSTFERIVCSPDATKPELYAAGEFQTLFKGLTGKELKIGQAASKSGKNILIGARAFVSSGFKANTDGLEEEGFRIDIQDDNLSVYGGAPRGTLYGVYEFFEQYCGVRYLTYDHTYYPPEGKEKDFRIKGRSYRYVPPFVFRWSYYGETNQNPAFAARLRTNTVEGPEELGGITGYKLVGHNVAYLVPPAVYGKEHPEYYALVDGRRLLEMHGGGPQLCLTNPDVLEIVVKATLDAIEKNPDVKNFNIAQMDNGGYCICDSCAALDAREGSHAGTMLSFVNAVAERIEKVHPEVLIGTYAYEYTRKPPKTIRARDNVLIQLCSIECCTFHAVDDPTCSQNRAFCADMDGWKEKAKNIFIWNYNTNFRAYLLPFPNLRSIGKNVEYFADNNGRGVFMQAAGDGLSTELSDLRNYVMSRCLWKPGRDSWKEAMEFCRLHYAESAQPIIDYLTWYHQLIDKEKKHPGCFPTEASLCINPETAKRIEKYFDGALVLAKSDEVRSRVEKASLCAYRAKLSAATMKLKYENGVCKPAVDNGDEDLPARYTELCRKYNVGRESEYMSNELYLEKVRKIYSGMTAVRLENDLWRVLILPESNAKVVEMTYKPTGRNVVQPARSLDRFRYEEWGRQGDVPRSDNILTYKVIEKKPAKTVLALTTKDVSRIERTISLTGDAVRFETILKAGEARSFNFLVHPEYDAGSDSDDPQETGIYVKADKWIQANKGWVNARPTDEQKALIKEGLKGGAFAFFNQKAGFGVEQRFDPEDFENLDLFWSPERIQVNLEMIPNVKKLREGEQTKFAYEVLYLDKAPDTR